MEQRQDVVLDRRADARGRKREYRKGDIGFHHHAFELSSRKDVDALGAFSPRTG
jgi:hypothetical protein